MLFHKKKPAVSFDRSKREPAVRKSICTGEMTVGFVDKPNQGVDLNWQAWITDPNGIRIELMKIESLEEFKEQVGDETIKIIY